MRSKKKAIDELKQRCTTDFEVKAGEFLQRLYEYLGRSTFGEFKIRISNAYAEIEKFLEKNK